MIQARNLARIALRWSPRPIASPVSQQLLSRVPRLRALQAFPKPTTTLKACAAFSTSRPRCDVNGELTAKLESEIALEKETRENTDGNSNFLKDEVKEFLDSSGFELHDTPGVEEVILTRQVNDEKVKVIFTVADMNAHEEDEEDPDEADVFGDEEDMPPNTQSGGANTKGSVEKGHTSGSNVKIAPETGNAPAGRPEIDDESAGEDTTQPRSFPVNIQVVVERPGKGAITCDATVNDGEYMFVNMSCYPEAEMATPTSPEKEFQRRNIYTGPPFTNLDEDLQVLLERYLEERGVDTRMALFIPEYIDFKEQREYERWLKNLKSFVES